jgi:glycosyltransferase involved in cell wall biosynthesis
MKILSVTRLFSGLETSFINKKWEPTGVPTIFKMIEEFDTQALQYHGIFTSKDGFSRWESKDIYYGNIEGLKNKISILPGRYQFPQFLGHKVRVILRELFQLFYVLRVYIKMKPDIIYFDHANTIIGAFFSLIGFKNTVYRVMGVYPAMRNSLKKRNWSDYIMSFCYGRPYSLVICTQDGSGIEPWLNEIIHKETKIHKLINGVNLDSVSQEMDFEFFQNTTIENLDNKLKILFVGKLEKAKGADSFLKAMIELSKSTKDFLAIIIGDGSLAQGMKEEIKELGLEEQFHFAGRVPHKYILKAHQISDVYISLNRLGNMSVANLEAMKFGQCMIFPKGQPETSIDLITEELFPDDCCLRIENSDDIEGILTHLKLVSESKAISTQLKNKMKERAIKIIPTWEQRVQKEFDILKTEFATDSN